MSLCAIAASHHQVDCTELVWLPSEGLREDDGCYPDWERKGRLQASVIVGSLRYMFVKTSSMLFVIIIIAIRNNNTTKMQNWLWHIMFEKLLIQGRMNLHIFRLLVLSIFSHEVPSFFP